MCAQLYNVSDDNVYEVLLSKGVSKAHCAFNAVYKLFQWGSKLRTWMENPKVDL